MITKYSQISRDVYIVLENYNANTDSLIRIEKICFLPLFRVVKQKHSNFQDVYERFSMDEKEVNLEFSNLMKEKMELF